ncbi:hypothetical protein Tco_0847399 [Tanacetum coccineum]
MPTGKIGVYTRFFGIGQFSFAIYLSFLVNVLRHYRIHISQLSVIGAAKVSHFEILYRVHGFEPTVGLFRCFYVNSKNKGWMSFSKGQGNDTVCYTKPLDSLKSWNDQFFWVDAFAFPASFPWNTSKSMSKDPFPKSFNFNAEHYATLVAMPAPFYKYLEPFICLIGISQMDLLSFIRTADPTKVRVGERQRAEDEPKLLDTTVGRIVPLLPVTPACSKSELEDSVDKLFDKGGSDDQAKQGNSADGGQGVGIQFVSEAAEVVAEDVASLQPRRQKKRKTVSALQRLLAGAVLNPEVGIAALPTLPFVTSFVSATPEQEGEDQTDSVAGANLRTITAPQRFVISLDSITIQCYGHSSTYLPSLFGAGSSSAGGTDSAPGEFFDVSGSEFLIGGIRTVVDLDFDLQKVYVPQWSVTNGSCLDDGRVCREMLDEFAPPKFFASICRIERTDLHFFFTRLNVGAARQISLSTEVRMRVEYNIKEKRRLRSVVDEQTELLKVRDRDIENLKAQLLLKEAEAAKAIRLRAEASKFEAIEKSLQDEVRVLKDHNTTLEKEKSELDVKVADLVASVKVREQEAADLDAMVHKLETSSAVLQEKVTVYEDCMSQLEKFQDERMEVVYEKFNKLHADFIEMALHLEEKFYPHLLTTIAGRRWLLTYGMELVFAKCLNSPEYLSALGAAISKAIEKGMQDGPAIGITHGQEGRVLTDVAAFNPSAKSDYISALQDLQSVNFSLLADLKSNKDASLETLMDILRLDETLAERLGLNESQPHVDQLMVPVHHSPDQTVIGARALSLSLDVSHSRVQRIKENIANNRPALHDVFVPLAEPLSIVAFEDTGGTSGTAPDTTTAIVILTCCAPLFTISTMTTWLYRLRKCRQVMVRMLTLPNIEDC